MFIVYKKENDYYICVCSDGRTFKIDEEDYPRVCPYICYFATTGNVRISLENGRSDSLARYIVGVVEKNKKVLVRNGDKSDLRKANLFYGNTYEYVDGHIEGLCFDGHRFLIDEDSLPLVQPYIWHVDKNGYVITKHNGRVLKQHRMIMGIIDDHDVEVDHIYHNTLDNRKSQLRICNRSVNCINRRKGIGNKSGVVGVYWMSSVNRWAAQIRLDKKTYYLGTFESVELAAAARKNAEETLLPESYKTPISSEAANSGTSNDYPVRE